MRRGKALSLVTSLVVASVGLMAPQATAAEAVVAGFQGRMSVTPGLYAPGFGPAQTYDWSLVATQCASARAGKNGLGTDTACSMGPGGTATGWCGRSTGTWSGPHHGYDGTISWEWVGTALVGAGTATNSATGQSGLIVVAASVSPVQEGCTNGTATEFDIGGGAIIVAQ